ncbi:MAG: amidase [Dehalococcoidia bacterium]|nr:amidase [Dehalococcoidia bacterium]
MTDLSDLTIAEASRLLEKREVTAVELLEAHLTRIVTTEPALNSYVVVLVDTARAEAEASDARVVDGGRLGPLDGIPIAVKDLYDIAGVVTTGGTGAYRSRVAAEDSTAVRRLRSAGAVFLGKTNTHELAFGGTTNNIHYGATHNPWNLERVPGGSSGGSGSALAARQALGALGTDTGGSIRIPAAFCGVTGHKPTYGLVGRTGITPLSHTLDHAGPMARTAEDCALLLDVLTGYDEHDLDSIARPAVDFTAGLEDGVGGLRFAIIPSMLKDAVPAVEANFLAAVDVLRSLGATVIEVEPMEDHPDWRAALTGLISVECYSYHQALMEEPSQIGPAVRSRIAQAFDRTAWDYARGLDVRKLAERHFEAVLREHHLAGYLAPTSPITAPPIDPDQERDQAPPTIFVNTTVFDMTHQPSISVPCGFDAEGLPTGLMISGALWDDATVLSAAHAFQGATDWHTKAPALPDGD